MGLRKITKLSSSDKGFATISTVVILVIILTVLAGVSTIFFIVNANAKAVDEKAGLEVSSNNIFALVDVILYEETKILFEKTKQEQALINTDGKTEEEKKNIFLKKFFEGTMELKNKISSELSNNEETFYKISGRNYSHISVSYMMYDYNDEKYKVVNYSEISSAKLSSDIGLWVKIWADGTDGSTYEFDKRYFFDFDEKISGTKNFTEEDIILGETEYTRSR